MTDTEIIQSAYANALDKLFAVFFDKLATSSQNDAATQKAADDFKKGVALARTARDRALQLMK